MRIGIIGAGQLGQMLGFAARGLEIDWIRAEGLRRSDRPGEPSL